MLVDDSPLSNSPWHEGELLLQTQAGVQQRLQTMGSRIIRPMMLDQHRRFFNKLPFLIIGSEDCDGYLWASVLFDEPGFIQSPSPDQLSVFISPHNSDAMALSLDAGDFIGLLGIDFSTRRRNRLNGVVKNNGDGWLHVEVDQSFGNCNKYINVRHIVDNPGVTNPGSGGTSATRVTEFTDWNRELCEWITHADTCFIASASRGLSSRPKLGIDVSHRGGAPGFIRMDKHQRLLIPDYAGNNFFNTLGNITIHPRAGLLFFDFARGHLLQITTTAEIIDSPNDYADAGVARFIRLTLMKGRVWNNASPYLWHRG